MSLFAELNGALTSVLESTTNAYLRLAPESLEQLGRLQGKVIALHLRGLEKTLYLIPSPAGMMLQSHFEGEPDAMLSGTPIAFAELSTSANANRVLFKGDVKISGDLRLGQDFKRILDEMDIDWEEVLSKYTGDVVAHKVGDLLRGASQWGKDALQIMGQNATEYLQQESLDLPTKEETAPFITNVDTLRDDVERLEARVARLQQHLKKD